MNNNMNKSTTSTNQPNQDSIAYHAYLLWEKAGRPSGRDQELWFQAEAQLRSTSTSKPSSTPAPAVQVASKPAAAIAPAAPITPITPKPVVATAPVAPIAAKPTANAVPAAASPAKTPSAAPVPAAPVKPAGKKRKAA
jgi:hypothetical protein